MSIQPCAHNLTNARVLTPIQSFYKLFTSSSPLNASRLTTDSVRRFNIKLSEHAVNGLHRLLIDKIALQ